MGRVGRAGLVAVALTRVIILPRWMVTDTYTIVSPLKLQILAGAAPPPPRHRGILAALRNGTGTGHRVT